MDNSEHDEHLHFPSSDEDGCQRSRKNVKNSPTEWDAETLELASQYGYSRSDLDTEGLEGEFDEELEEECKYWLRILQYQELTENRPVPGCQCL